MKNFCIVAMASLTFSSLQANSNLNTDEIKNSLEEFANEEWVFGNGQYYWSKYTISSFSLEKRTEEFEILNAENIENGSDCSMSVSSGVDESIDDIQNYAYDDFTADLLKSSKDLILEIVANEWNGEEGDSESCNIFQYDIFFKDGSLLHLDYQLTD